MNFEPPSPAEPRLRQSRWGNLGAIASLLALTGLFLAVLELRDPYFFLWDDNASFYLPSYAYNYETVMGRGELPHLNYHQYLGYTHLASGQTAVLYPLLYPALLAAQLGWGDLRPAIDIAGVLHLALAAIGMYLLLRRFGLGQRLSVALGFLWITSPFLVVVSRSWIFVSYAAAFMPWSLLALERLLARPTPPRILALAVIKALFLYQGYVQYAVLATLFEGLYVLSRWLFVREARADWRRQAIGYALALAATGALAAPLLLPMYHAKQVSAYRTAALSFEEFVSNSLRLDTFLAAQLLRMEPGAVHQSSGAIFYVGIPNLLALGALFSARRHAFSTAAAAVALFALVLSTSAAGLMYAIPILSSFRWPFKSFLVVLFFLTIALAGCYQTLLLSSRRGSRRLAVFLLLAAMTGNVAIVLTDRLAAPFGPNRVGQEVSRLRQEAAQRFPIEEGRAVSLWMSPFEARSPPLLAFGYATLLGVHHLGGYDPLIARENLELALNLEYSNIFRYELTPEALDYLSSWSVRFLVVPEQEALRRFFGPFPQLRLAYRGGGLEVWENTSALPFAYFSDAEGAPVEVAWGTDGVRLETNGRGGRLRVAIAPLAWYQWEADGREMGGVAYDEERHVVLEVPSGTQEVVIRYLDLPFRLGVLVFLAFIFSVAAIWITRRWRRRGSSSSRPDLRSTLAVFIS